MRRIFTQVSVVIALGAGSMVGVPIRAEARTSSVQLAPGESTVMVMRRTSSRSGEWVIKARFSSDGEKAVRVTARRVGGPAFRVLDTRTSDVCDGAAGSLYCQNITVPAVPAPGTWRFRVRNLGNRPVHSTFTVTWRRVNGG